MTRYWRHLVARYGAYPVAWCVAGEATMPYYLSATGEADRAAQKDGWTAVMRSVRETDPYHNMITVHPTQSGREQVHTPKWMDSEMLQTGHGDLDSVPNVIRSGSEGAKSPTKRMASCAWASPGGSAWCMRPWRGTRLRCRPSNPASDIGRGITIR